MARGRAANYDEQREAILRHAARLFARRGYIGTSMNQVAEAAGLSKASLYHYYRDKYAMLVEIAVGHVTTLEALVEEVRAQRRAPADAVRHLIERIIDEYADAQDAHRVLTEDVRFLEPEDRARVLGAERRVVAGFAEAIGAWQPGQAEAGLTKPLTMLLFGMINWLFTWHRPEGGLRHADLAPIVADLFFAGVPGVRPPAGTPAPATAAGDGARPSSAAGTTPVPAPSPPPLLTP
jgi:AcrR family transcriptional regulator